MYRYQIKIYWSDEDQTYVVEIPELPGCMAHGDTHDAALSNANETIKLWVDTAEGFGGSGTRAKGQHLMRA